jgi:hypothetical protein
VLLLARRQLQNLTGSVPRGTSYSINRQAPVGPPSAVRARPCAVVRAGQGDRRQDHGEPREILVPVPVQVRRMWPARRGRGV